MNPVGLPMDTYRSLLLSFADTDPLEPAALALAGVLEQAWQAHGLAWLPLSGLGAEPTRLALERWFPGADRRLGLDWPALAQADRPEPRQDEVDDLLDLLREHMALPAGTSDEREAVAHAIACACLGNNHLWQDLALPSRAELSALIATWFPTLAALNHQNMKWKKFFYKQLCLRHELFICRAPSCAVCADQALCFGPE